jgi:DNA-binding MarR family transcriptional regulator
VHITERGQALNAELSERIAAERLLGEIDEREAAALLGALSSLLAALR